MDTLASQAAPPHPGKQSHVPEGEQVPWLEQGDAAPRVRGLGFRVEGLGLGFRVEGLWLRVWGLGFQVWGLGCMVQGLGLRV